MKPLDRKLLRDLFTMKGQALAIALVLASGIATFVMSVTTLESLRTTRATYYEDYEFANVFASLKRAPDGLRQRIAELPGVLKVDTRVVAAVSLDIEGFDDPVTGELISIPDGSLPELNRLYLRRGRFATSGRVDEIVIGESFADAHGIGPGEELSATINGRRRTLTVVGVALSPDHTFQISPGSLFPDFKRYGIFWMVRAPLSSAYDMEGAFNQVTLKLTSDAIEEDVITRLDDILAPYGGHGAYGRADQMSHHFLSEEIKQLGNMASIFPTIFLSVAAFLLNVVIGRVVSAQREQIAILKAFGYTNFDIGLHYAKLVTLISTVGIVLGLILGAWLGSGLSSIYKTYYKFPYLNFELGGDVVVYAVLISIAAASVGTGFALRRAMILPPAEAMRPEPPMSYRETIVERLGLRRFFHQPTRMIIRHIERRPVKALFSILGIALSCAILMMGNFFEDSVDHMIDVQFALSQREDISVTFIEPTSRRALHDFEGLRGVEYAEPFRAVPVKLKFEHKTYRTGVQGMPAMGELQRVVDKNLKAIELPQDGILLTDYLGEILGAEVGDTLIVEVLEGSRQKREVPLVGFVAQYTGVSAYMELVALNRLMGEGSAISGVNLAIDAQYQDEIYRTIKDMPRVAGTVAKKDALDNFQETMSDQMLLFTFINTMLAIVIAFGVVYNTARIALSERSRELASLRVLGFTRGEISYILLGELAILTIVAIPIGFLIGRALCAYMVSNLASDLYRIPLIVEASTYAFSTTVVLIAACVSALIVRRRLDTLDLVSVLKARE